MGRWVDGQMGRFGHCIGLTHTQRYHAHYHTAGEGPVYQGRLKSFPVQDDEHFLRVARYVERNAYSAGLCERPEAWQWGSLHHWSHWSHGSAVARKRLSGWPVRRHPNWTEQVATAFSDKQRERLQWSVRRGVPFGDEGWTEHVARVFDLESTMRPRGRPRKRPEPTDAK